MRRPDSPEWLFEWKNSYSGLLFFAEILCKIINKLYFFFIELGNVECLKQYQYCRFGMPVFFG